MYEDLARSQEPSALEWLVVNVLVPSLLVTFALQWRVERPTELRRLEAEGPIVTILPVMGLDEAFIRFGPIPDFFPKLLSMPRPGYPPVLRGSASQPRVFLRALVEPNGSVSPSSIVIVQSPDPRFNEEARRALMAAVFHPARLAGHAIGAWITIAVNFNPRPE